MLDLFTALLLLGITGLLVYIVIQVVRDDQQRAREAEADRAAQRRRQSLR